MYTYNLTRRRRAACCCAQRDKIKRKLTKHGLRHLPEYKIWLSMRHRCRNKKDARYKYYGGRGVAVSKEWDEFSCFYSDMGPKPSPFHSIERKNNDGNYEKDNCKWATSKEQSLNRRTNRLLTFNGKTQCLSEWAKELGLSKSRLENRILSNWSDEDAFTVPPQKRSPPGRPLTFNGETKPLAQWAKEAGLTERCLINRIIKLKWSTEKALVTRPNTRVITYNGKTQHLAEWSKEVGLTERCLINRIIKLKWPIEKALTTPDRGWASGRPKKLAIRRPIT